MHKPVLLSQERMLCFNQLKMAHLWLHIPSLLLNPGLQSVRIFVYPSKKQDLSSDSFRNSLLTLSGSQFLLLGGTMMVVFKTTKWFFLKPKRINFVFFIDVESVCTDCGVSPPWLLYLCIAFGILFLVMLIINVFLCSAMTCSCARTESMEKEPSIIEEFDPYTRSWQGSQYGSRFSLNGNIKPIPPPLISVDTSHSISSSSECGIPAVYGLPVHSRPSSRYSNRSHKRGHHGHQSAASSSGSTAHYSKYSNGRHIVK